MTPDVPRGTDSGRIVTGPKGEQVKEGCLDRIYNKILNGYLKNGIPKT